MAVAIPGMAVGIPRQRLQISTTKTIRIARDTGVSSPCNRELIEHCALDGNSLKLSGHTECLTETLRGSVVGSSPMRIEDIKNLLDPSANVLHFIKLVG